MNAAGLQKQAPAGSMAAFATHLADHPDDRPDVMLNRIGPAAALTDSARRGVRINSLNNPNSSPTVAK